MEHQKPVRIIIQSMSHLRMYNEYFAPYRAAVEAGVGSVMSSFNIVDGIPATANKWLLTERASDEWGFQDFWSQTQFHCWKFFMEAFEGSLCALQAGGRIWTWFPAAFNNTLEESLKEGKSPKHRLMQLAVVCWRLKYKLGLFADP